MDSHNARAGTQSGSEGAQHLELMHPAPAIPHMVADNVLRLVVEQAFGDLTLDSGLASPGMHQADTLRLWTVPQATKGLHPVGFDSGLQMYANMQP